MTKIGKYKNLNYIHSKEDWQKYEVAPNGSLQKTCGGCGRMSLIEKQIEI